MHGQMVLGMILTGVVLAAGSVGCQQAEFKAYSLADRDAQGVAGSAGLDRMREVYAPAAPLPAAELTADKIESAPASQRILIYTAALDMAVADVEAALTAAQKSAEEAGGYMQALTSESITLRVPADRFRDVVAQLSGLGQTLQKNIRAQDVTDEYVDLQLRLKNAEAMLARLTDILARAETVKDILEVERELGRVREEVERLKGRLAALDKQIAFSTIEVHFTRTAGRTARRVLPENPFPWLDEMGVEHVLRFGS